MFVYQRVSISPARLTPSFLHKVVTGPWHRGKSPHPDGVLMQPAAAIHHDTHGADRPLSRQGGPKHGVGLVEQVVEKALATLTSNMITMETPLICTIQTWENLGEGWSLVWCVCVCVCLSSLCIGVLGEAFWGAKMHESLH